MVLQAEASDAIFGGGRGGIKGEGGSRESTYGREVLMAVRRHTGNGRQARSSNSLTFFSNRTDVSTLAVVERKCVSSEEICLLTVREQLSRPGRLDIPKRTSSTVSTVERYSSAETIAEKTHLP